MQIDASQKAVQGFCSYWKLAVDCDWPDTKRARYAQTLQADLAGSIAKEALPYGGQLILTYHEFLSMEPSGAHSFAHGSEMQSKTVYWVTIARLPRLVSLEQTKASSRTLQAGGGGSKIRFNTPARFFFPVRWTRQLWPIYPGTSRQPSFTLERPDKKPDDLADDKLLNIGALGEHLFRTGPVGKLDWATKIYLVVGTSAVKSWLIRHQSVAAYEKIRSCSEFR